jgi:hypothetical protein
VYLWRRHAPSSAPADANENIDASGGHASGSARATLKNILVRQGFSYRHLLCEALPNLRARLPPPAPLAAGLSPAQRAEVEAVAGPRVDGGASPPPRRLAVVARNA